ncbi:MAG: nucleotidyltransferase [Bacilli bacterium]|nr:nucleotidyltransferase [Bacilli bacterium]
MVGIICEYNPFHNGHLYHINRVKEMFPDSKIVLIMSGNFLQRGDISVINKWDKTKIALDYGVSLVVELPFVFASQGADIFAHGAIQILNNLGVEKLVFGSECNDIELLKGLASIQINNNNYDDIVLKYLNLGYNYPTSMSLALEDISNTTISSPNDILGLCYVKEIMLMHSRIEPFTIKRTSDYHGEGLGTICSATAIRRAIKDGKDITGFVPSMSLEYINNVCTDDLFKFFKYKVMTSDISNIQTVDLCIIPRIIKNINCNNMEEFIKCVKTKRYTYNRIKRMIIHILCNFTKEEARINSDIHYIRILGFDSYGRKYLSSIKKKCKVPIISNFSGIKDSMLDIEYRSTCVYSLLFDKGNDIIQSEYKNKPIIK